MGSKERFFGDGGGYGRILGGRVGRGFGEMEVELLFGFMVDVDVDVVVGVCGVDWSKVGDDSGLNKQRGGAALIFMAVEAECWTMEAQ